MQQDLTRGATQGIVKIGDCVHRPRNNWSPAIEALLLHLEDIGFEYSPQFLGVDSEGRQVLSYIEGEVGHYPAHSYVWTDESLCKIAKILRSFHDATESFKWNEYDCWQFTCPSDQKSEVLCHNDFSTYNCVFQNQSPVGMIDFDTCGPGSRVWDIAYTAFRCIPIASIEQQRAWGCTNTISITEKLDILLQGYGYIEDTKILDIIYNRLQTIREHVAAEALGDSYNASRIRAEKHIESYDESIAHFVQETSYRVPNK